MWSSSFFIEKLSPQSLQIKYGFGDMVGSKENYFLRLSRNTSFITFEKLTELVVLRIAFA